MTPAELSEAVLAAVRAAVDAGDLEVQVPTEVKVERPKVREHGDYATNVAMQLARPAGRPPREVAEAVAGPLRATAGIKQVDVAGPGFLNITLDSAAQGELARTVVTAGEAYGRSTALAGQRLNLEFVSANPTGPLHLGHVRWAAVGDALGRILEAAGAQVTTEYYFNDAGNQVNNFALSLDAAARGLPTPETGYAGEYVGEIAAQVVERNPGLLDQPEEKRLEIFRRDGLEIMFAEIKQSLVDFDVHFDVFFNEKSLHDKGELDDALKRLREQGHIEERDGAIWLRTTDFGDDRDRVLVKRDGSWTYFAADCAYYLDKRQRGFDKALYMLGSDHHGYVGRLHAVAACFGDSPGEFLEVLIGQFVNLFRAGQPVRLSKRAGNIITLQELVDAIGKDAGRYALARYSTDSPIDLDLEVWTKHTNDNPVYYVQYGHARVSGVLRNARDLGVELGDPDAFRPELLEHEREGDLLRALGEFPRVVATAAELREAHRVARYLEELAGTFHRFYDVCRVLPRGDEEVSDLHRARLWLVEATRVVLANGLGLLGVTAPERM